MLGLAPGFPQILFHLFGHGHVADGRDDFCRGTILSAHEAAIGLQPGIAAPIGPIFSPIGNDQLFHLACHHVAQRLLNPVLIVRVEAGHDVLAHKLLRRNVQKLSA